jgi:hypothetical protein
MWVILSIIYNILLIHKTGQQTSQTFENLTRGELKYVFNRRQGNSDNIKIR